ncbi:GntR family transcriptional regulator [Rothia sp. HMSC069C03]|uniref:GntR family transcriptional regulator n=1 Tax=unclassified Rothia (in: high G+C Gram-positive bacteria) TaxID=2689056 RepID=UPI0008A5CE7F|nr:GntR family transcriptional regulator [Rothia sp. HMSC069C03]OFQ65713.1 GntR family transcriptional regulator [Rothia sp. HMSC061E04]
MMNSHSSQTTDHGAPSHSAGTTASESAAHNAESRYELPPIPGPKYEQVIHYIEQRYIIPGKPGDKLPTERMIQQNFGVSRQTVRSALKVLIERGLIYNVQGSGTYVAEHTEATYIPRVGTFVDDMRRRGFEGSTRMIATRWMDATEEISTHLSVPVGEQVLFVRRLRLADHEVIGFERSYFVKAAASSILDAMMAEMSGASSSFDQLADTPNAIKHARVRTSAGLFTDADAEAFNHQVPVGEAAFKVCTTGYTEEGSPVEYSETLYLADAYFYEMIL